MYIMLVNCPVLLELTEKLALKWDQSLISEPKHIDLKMSFKSPCWNRLPLTTRSSKSVSIVPLRRTEVTIV